ncbi:hypothetical protein GCM10023210_13080 [Chryseobacterium ginsengisoli]|uniref:Glycine zipper family protein n=1 Tax=Chryseobacterium ginsengisoli TaxID=363853 RepID=A0ABP9M1A3_9FLAO
MEINQLNLKFDQVHNPNLIGLYFQIQDILKKTNNKKLPTEAVQYINHIVEQINSSTLKDKPLLELLEEKQNYIVKFLEKKYDIVPRNHFRNMWISLGALIFGLPVGVLLIYIFDQTGFLVLGLLAGAGIGTLVSISMDTKALREGKQLNIELKY